VAEAPDGIDLARHRDFRGRAWHPWVRRGLCAALAALPILALADIFGQRPAVSRASAPAAELKIYAPTRLRGGLIFEARFRIAARREIRKATLVLAPGWTEGMSINTLEPSPVAESSREGRLALDLGHVAAGDAIVFFMQFQVNPTNVGHRSQDVELDDDTTPLVVSHRQVTVYP
jgi:hypothetical protein